MRAHRPSAALLACALAAGLPGRLPGQDGARVVDQQGRVLDVLGDPVPAASLQVVHEERILARTASDGEGTYRIRAPALSGAELRVAARGKAEQRHPWGGLGRCGPRNLVLDDGCALRGRVLDARGRAVPGATVVMADGNCTIVVRTDGDGAYALPAAPLRAVHLRAWGPSTFADRRLALREDTVCDFALPAEPAAQRLVRVQGLPAHVLATACLQVLSYDLAVRPEKERIPLAADGTAQILPSDTSLVKLVAPGYEAMPLGWLVHARGHEELVFATRRTAPEERARLRGRLHDPDGRPLAGLRLVVEDRFHGQVGSGTTDGDGRFDLATALPAGVYCRMGLELGDWEFADDEARFAGGFSWIEAFSSDERRFALGCQTASALRSTVEDGRGVRFAFAEVLVAPRDAPQHPCAVLTTDHAGTFAVHGLPEDHYSIAAIAEGGGIATAEVVVFGGRLRTVTGWKSVDSGTVAGRVVDAAGRPVPGVELHLVSPELQEMVGDPLAGRLDARVRTDRHGRFRCRGLHGGRWLVVPPEELRIDAQRATVAAGRTAQVEFRVK